MKIEIKRKAHLKLYKWNEIVRKSEKILEKDMLLRPSVVKYNGHEYYKSRAKSLEKLKGLEFVGYFTEDKKIAVLVDARKEIYFILADMIKEF